MEETININFENSFYKGSLNIRNDERLSSCSVLNKINGDVTNFVEVSKLIKPKLTEDEKVILRNLPKEYEWIARDEDGELYIYDKPEPFKEKINWYNESKSSELYIFNHKFQFIKWEDEEPYNIKELLKE